MANSDKGITTVQHQPISSDSKTLDDILKQIDRMSKRLDTLEKSEKAPEKKPVFPSIMVGIEVEIGITLNVMVGVGAIKTIEVMEKKIARTKTNQKQTTKRKVKVI